MAGLQVAPEDQFDYILVGAGGAGMCLLEVMSDRSFLDGRRLLILDPDPKRDNNRTWCFWAEPDEPIVAGPGRCACPVWDKVEVAGRTQLLPSAKFGLLQQGKEAIIGDARCKLAFAFCK